MSLHNFQSINRCRRQRRWNVSNRKLPHCWCLHTSGAKPTDSRDEISMFDDSVPNPHIRESTCANTYERNIRSYNHIYLKKWYQIQPYIFMPIWRAFSKYRTVLPFSSQNNDKAFQLSLFKSFQYSMLYIHKIDKNYTGIQSQRCDMKTVLTKKIYYWKWFLKYTTIRQEMKKNYSLTKS